MKIAIVLNKARTTDSLIQQLNQSELFSKYHLTYDLYILKPEEISSTLQNLNLQSYSALLVGGGDGTVRTAAELLMNSELPLAILPLGTFNLLAKSLGHVNDIEATLSMIKNNKTKSIDLARVNDKIFINHVWIGFYYQILKLRKKHQHIIGTNRLFKVLFNLFNLFKPLQFYDLNLQVEDKQLSFRTCLIFISNNESFTNLFDFGEHKTLSSGLLHVSILNCKTREELFAGFAHMLLGKFKDSQYYSQFTTDHLTISAKKTTIHVVVDGDLFDLTTPIQFSNHQKQLRVFIP